MDYQKKYIELNPSLHVEDAPKKYYEIASLLGNLSSCKSILDIACGAGRVTSLLKKHFKTAHVVGIDISEAMISKAKELNAGADIDWQVVDVFYFKPKQKFDLVVCADIIEHIKGDVVFLKQIKNFGREIIIRVPMENSFWNKVMKFLKIRDELKRTEKQYGHVHHYSKKSFESILEKSGLKVVDYQEFLINKRRNWYLNEIVRILTKPIGTFSKELAIKLSGGFIVYRLTTRS